MKKSYLIKIAALLCTGAMFLSGCGQQVVEVSEWEEGQGTTQQVQYSSGTQGSTTTTTNTTSANFELTKVDSVEKTTATGKTYNLKGATVTIAGYGSIKPDAGSNEAKVISDIEKKYNCKIEWKEVGSSMGYYDQFAAAAQAGVKFADIAQQSTAQAHTKQFKMGYWAPLSDFMDTTESIFNQSAREQMAYKGKDYVVVMSNRWYAPAPLYFNRAIFDKFGEKTPDTYVDSNTWTLDNFLALAKRLTKKDGGTQYYGFATDMNSIGHFQRAFGGKDIIERDGKKYYEPDANLIAGTQYASDMIWKYEVSPSTMTSGIDALKSGTTAMGVTDTFRVSTLFDAIGAENVGATWFPRSENGTHSATVGETTCYGIPSTADKDNWEAYGQILRDYKYPYRWRETLRQQSENCAGDEKSIQTIMDMTKYANEHMDLQPLYDYISRTIGWSDKGISKQQSPQAYYDSVKSGAQAELDAFWDQ